MKKLITLLLVLGMATVASADIISVQMDSLGSNDHSGVVGDEFDVGETVGISVVVNRNLYDPAGGTFPSYDGYFVTAMDIALQVTGPGALSAPPLLNTKGEFVRDDIMIAGAMDVVGNVPAIDGLNVSRATYGSLSAGVSGSPSHDSRLIWNLIFTCTGPGAATINLAQAGSIEAGQFTDLNDALGTMPYPDSNEVPASFFEENLGDLVIHQIPEPMTLALLGLGSLGLLRRRRRA